MTWAVEDVNAMKDLFEQGYTDKEIGEFLDKHEKSVESKRRRLGIVNWNVNNWSENDLDTLTEMYNEGYEDKEIAENLGRSYNAVVSKRLYLGLLRVKYALIIDGEVKKWSLGTKKEALNYVDKNKEKLLENYDKEEIIIIEYKEMDLI